MGDGAVLFIVCCMMAVGTYLVATLPLVFQLSRSSLRKLELWGAGLLLGAALTVVIPEGIASVYKGDMCPGPGQEHPKKEHHFLRPKDVIALSLLCGFVLMFVVDQHMIAQSHRQGEQNGQPVSMTHGEEGPEESSSEWRPNASFHQSFKKMVGNLLGVLLHAVADGIAMGSSIESVDTSLRFVVVLAIMVHKAPASIGICTLMMSRQLRRNDIHLGILIFSLTTPISALLTYFTLQMLFVTSASSGDGMDAREIGAILSFSGGTFLYVAIHAVMELASSEADVLAATHSEHVHHPHDHDHPIHAHLAAPSSHTPLHSSRTEDPESISPLPVQPAHHTTSSLVYVVLGSIVPRLLQLLIGDHVHPH